MGKFYQCIQSYGPSFMTKFCSALYLENLLRNIFAKLDLRGGVSCMPAVLLFIQNIHCGYSLEPPWQGGSNVYPQCMIWAKIIKKKKSKFFQ